MYLESLKNLKKIGIKLNDEFFNLEKFEAPLLKGINVLLQSIDLKGLTLTKNGFLPTKVVKSIVEVAATESDKRYLSVQTRFYEEENLSANMARVVSETLKLIKVQKGKLLLTKKGNEFLSLTPHEQYIILFNIMLGINIGYFDRHQEALSVHNSSLIMLHLLRDKDKNFRTVEVYTALLLDAYPILDDGIEALELLDYGEKDKLNIFASIAETRLFERLFLPLGLIDMQTAKYPQKDTFAKSALLDNFISEKHAINKNLVLSKKLLKTFQDEIRQNKLDINLFEVTMYLFAQYAHIPLAPKSSVVDALMQKHPLLGTLRTSYTQLYEKLIDSVLTTYEEFTQLDTVGASRDNLADEYMHMIDSLFALANTPKPFNTVQKLHILPAFIFDILKLHHNLNQFSQDFILECSKIFGEEFAMDIAQLMLLLERLEKDAKKLKKNKANFEQGVKEFLQTYLMIVLELRSREL
ncbi:hypothetical protein [Candidatus Sulfurimonas baltica]|uniref:Uncharacterized protein n=1 Tax=Candidatus Sulfurimonas baltica TaxID=2740404 RepID=A0A7S7LTD6_9BACT|nr:hypothetical protein [Candidatus Sulfurimonas baltica]QOY51201.1 hypothetical protein HUE88_08660 [Candidatus Sulfurimonas baltica]